MGAAQARRVGLVDLSQRLRENIELDDWEAIRPGLRVTVSLGVCARSDENDVHEQLERADAAMYRAKRTGRNRVECYSGHVEIETTR